MDIKEILSKLFSIDNVQLEERIQTVSSKFEATKSQMPIYETFDSFFASMPTRDAWTVSISAPDERYLIIGSRQRDKAQYVQFFEIYDDDIEFVISINVHKTILENKLSVYNSASFVADIVARSIQNVMEVLSDLIKGRNNLTFITFDSNDMFSTRTIAFVNNENFERYGEFSRLNRLKECNQNSFFMNAERVALVPEDFSIDIDFNSNLLTSVFQRIQTILSIRSVASNSAIENGRFHGLIQGQRNLDFSYALDDIHFNRDICAIYNWVYTDGNITDKAILARNVISIQCRFIDLLKTDTRVMATIQANHELYLRDNVNKYLEIKTKMGEFISSTLSQYSSYSIDIFNSFIRNLVAIFASVLTVFLANLMLAQPLDNILTKEVMGLFYLVLAGSLVYMLLTLIVTRVKIARNRDVYDLLKENYSGLISEGDIADVFKDDKLIKKSEKRVNRNVVIVVSVWILLLVTIVCILEKTSGHPLLFNGL